MDADERGWDWGKSCKHLGNMRSLRFLAAKLLLAALISFTWTPEILAQAPSWWVSWGVVNTNYPAKDFAPANIGQLKWFATNAFKELQSNFPGGAGTSVLAVVSSFSAYSNFVAVNVGQLKYVAKPFYDRLIAEGYTNSYPWTTNTTTDDEDFAPANIGQVKYVFNFDITHDSDGDGMPDWWELAHGLNPTNNADAASDADGDHFLNIYEYVHNSDPSSSNSTPSAGRFFYVSQAGSHTYPYTNWAMAATNIQTALDMATNDYDIVLVADGTYVGPKNRNLQFPSNPVMLTATNGAANCLIDGSGVDCVFLFNKGQGIETVLSDVTIRNGYPTNGAAGITCITSAPTVQHCAIQANAGVGLGCYYAGSDARIAACLIASNADDGIDCLGSSPSVVSCTIVGNATNGVWVYAGGPLIGDCVISSNDVGIACVWATPAITNCVMDNNGSCGIYAYGEDPTVSVCMVRSSYYGVYCYGADLLVADCMIASNYDGVYCYVASPLLTNCTIVGNGHSGIYAYYGSPTIQDCEIAWNWFGVFLSEYEPHVEGCIIRNNQSDGIYCEYSSYLLVEDCTIATNAGAGIWCFEADPFVSNCTIAANAKGIYCESSSPRVVTCQILDNATNGIECYASSCPTVQVCTIVSNMEGVYCNASDPTFDRCRILNSEYDGMYFYDSDPTIEDSIVGDNAWNGIICYTSSPSIYNCTLADNRWNGIALDNGSAPDLQNCILWGNYYDQVYGWGLPSITYCAVQDGWTGTGNITNNPLLVPVSYGLQADSPCIDAGSDASASTNDIDGEARWDDPDHSNIVSIVDMGADEFSDDDLDDMANFWEILYLGSTNASPTDDADSDGLNNLGEYESGTCPTNSNTDNDSSLDGEEVAVGTDPLNPASFPVDASGTVAYEGQQTGSILVVAVTVSNSWATNHSSSVATAGAYSIANMPNLTNYWFKAFRDSDGDVSKDATEAWGSYVSNSVFVATNVTGVGITLEDPDDDGDGLPDWWEMTHFTNLNETATGDADGDGLDNLGEYQNGSDPNIANTDSDQIGDGDEVGVGFDPASSNSYVLYADFEPTNGYVTGALSGQNGWTASSSNGAQVQIGVVRRGEQATWLEGLQENMTRACVSTNSVCISKMYVFLGSQHQPPTNLPSTASCLVSFNSTNGIVAFDGVAGQWVVATNTLLTGQWVQLGIEQNYSNQTWKLYVNGIEKLNGLGFKSSSVTNLNSLRLQSGNGGSVYCDDIGITEQ